MTIEQPDIIRLSERRWKLRRTYVFKDRVRGRTIAIPAGFCCDLASVPRAVWLLISPSDLGEAAPLLHDWIYRHAGEIPGCEPYKRWEADDLFNEVMAADNVQTWKRRLARQAVQKFGKGAFKKSPDPMQRAA